MAALVAPSFDIVGNMLQLKILALDQFRIIGDCPRQPQGPLKRIQVSRLEFHGETVAIAHTCAPGTRMIDGGQLCCIITHIRTLACVTGHDG